MKIHIALLLTLIAFIASAVPQGSKQHVPSSLEGIRLIDPSSGSFNHLSIVNVAGAIPSKDWNLCVTYAASRFYLNTWTNSISSSVVCDLLSGHKSISDILGTKAKVAIFIEDNAKSDMYLAVPGCWCRVNVRSLKDDNPDLQTLRDRYAKAILKGCVYACGSGASLDNRSAAHFNSLTLKGMDNTGITIAPDSYFPMQSYLHLVGGDDIVAPAGEDEE